MRIELKVVNKGFYEDYQLPHYATQGSAAIDLVCTEDITIYPGETKMIPTGLAIWIGSGVDELRGSSTEGEPTGTDLGVAGLILPRSGLGTKGLVLANTVGLIDEDYQGELMVSAWNRNNDIIGNRTTNLQFNQVPIELKAGDRFAQLTFIPVIRAKFDIVEEFSNNTHRGASGFGSTGK